ncbi:TPA: DUF551 domain-containing protein [Enterobacter roggenkampii]
MSTITKEWLQQKIADMEAARDEIPFGLDEDDSNTLEALGIALASLEAEPVAWLWSNRKHPREVTLVRPEDDELANPGLWSGWSYKALYAVPPAPEPMKNHQFRELVNELRDIAVEYHGTQQLRERIARTVRSAMLQGTENAESPTTMQAAPALDSSPKIAESPSGNSPVIPDGWVACSERMPTAGQKVLAYRPDAPESDDPLIRMATFVGRSAHGHGFDCYCKPTHWMPLPAAPQQEVAQALAKGMERYGDAMQELAKKEVK